MKRRMRRSTWSAGSSFTVPWTWQRKPSSLYSGAATMPERPSRRLAVTSSWLLPMLDTMPSPVTTTRRMVVLRGSSERFGRREQADPQILGLEDDLAVAGHAAVGDAQHQLAVDHPLQVQAVGHQL